MRMLILIMSLMMPVEIVAEEVCGYESYDTLEEPNFDCPSPGELEIVPDLRPPPSIPIQEGITIEAPWGGAVVHRDRLVQVGLNIKALRRLRWADRLRILTEFQIQLEHQEGVCNAHIEHANEGLNIYKNALDQANNRTSSAQAWYRSWWFGYTVGVVSAGLLVALSAYVVTVL